MNHINILKRAFHITVNYRVLWIFGILLALTAGGGGSGGGGGNSGARVNGNDFQGFNGNNPFSQFPDFQITPAITNTIIGVAIALTCVFLLLALIGIVVRYVSETAVIRMVDQHENTGEKLTFRQGWHLGWSGAAWRMFLMDLLTGFSFLVAFLAAAAIVCLPLLVWFTKNTPLEVLGTVITAGLGILLLFATIIVALALSLVLLIARRACALENLGVIDSLKRGFEIVKARLVDLLLMGIILFGVRLLWAIVGLVVLLAAVVAAVILGGLPGLLVGAIVAVFTQGATPWIVAGIVAAPIFIIAVIIPTALVGGWHQIFSSSAWTLSYREAVALEKTKQNGELPTPSAA